MYGMYAGSLRLPHVAQLVERSEDNHESVVKHILHRLLVADIASAHAPHPLGVCLVQFSEGIRVPLSASFYQPCYLHRKHNVSIYIVLQQSKRLHRKNTFFTEYE